MTDAFVSVYSAKSSNRTFMELKLDQSEYDYFDHSCSNRTFMELKLNREWSNSNASIKF